MRRRILVPVDGSDNALRAVAHAAQLAKGGGNEVHLLNVELPLETYGTVRAFLTAQQHRKATRERAQDALAPAARRLQRSRVPYKVHLVYGDIAPAIARTASRLKCQSIVMGTRGHGAIGNVLLGSVASR